MYSSTGAQGEGEVEDQSRGHRVRGVVFCTGPLCWVLLTTSLSVTVKAGEKKEKNKPSCGGWEAGYVRAQNYTNKKA